MPAREAAGRPLRVLRLTAFFHHPNVRSWPAQFDPVGGQQIQCLTQSMWLAQQGIDQTVLTFGFPGLPDEYEVVPGLRVRRARFPMPQWRSSTTGVVGLTRNWRWATQRICRSMRRLDAWVPDLVHVHADGQVDALALVPWIKRLFRVPLVLTVHCSRLTHYKPMSWLDSTLHQRAKEAELEAVHVADCVLCLNAATRDVLCASARPAPGRIEVLPDVIDTAALNAASAESLAAPVEQFASGPGPTIAFVGRLAHEKGWRTLLSALVSKRGSHWKVLFIGDGPQRAHLERRVADLGLQQRVFVTGFVPHSEVARMVRASAVVVMPSVHEELGGAALEAFTLRVPVVAYAVGGLKNTVGAVDERLLVPPGDLSALTDAVNTVLGRPQWLDDALERGAALVSRQYGLSTLMPRLLKKYSELRSAAGSP
jgi:2-deoxystreptamine N-acetyl-D-glucosaminyltransferase / 2-deoxystreptamine glucosyltransferase